MIFLPTEYTMVLLAVRSEILLPPAFGKKRDKEIG
jgi:hypothetical protein